MIYAISDIHGYYWEIYRWFDQMGNLAPFENGENKFVLLGDYIDYGPDSFKTLRLIHGVACYLQDMFVVLRGDHEEAFLDWLDRYSRPNAGEADMDSFPERNGWLRADSDTGYQTLRGFLEKEQWEFFSRITPTASELTLNREAARMILDNHQEIITWLRSLPYYYETERQIFVHAGIDERCPMRWQELTDSYIFVGKYPVSTGYFPKDIIAGHVAAAEAAGTPEHEGIYFDGASHYFIDGAVQETGKLLCLAYDEQNGRYYELLRTAKSPGKRDRVYGELKPLGK